MSEIRKHIEENLSNAEKAYDDAFYRYNEANEKLKKITLDVFWLKQDLEKAEKEKEKFTELLNELNNGGQNG